jgi:hypothetical protein
VEDTFKKFLAEEVSDKRLTAPEAREVRIGARMLAQSAQDRRAELGWVTHEIKAGLQGSELTPSAAEIIETIPHLKLAFGEKDLYSMKIHKSDTYDALKARFGFDDEQFRYVNSQVKDLQDLRVGERVLIPTAMTHLGHRGETLEEVATAFNKLFHTQGITPESIAKLNGFSAEEPLKSGQLVLVNLPPDAEF